MQAGSPERVRPVVAVNQTPGARAVPRSQRAAPPWGHRIIWPLPPPSPAADGDRPRSVTATSVAPARNFPSNQFRLAEPGRRLALHSHNRQRPVQFRVRVVKVRREAEVFLPFAVRAQRTDDAIFQKLLMQRRQIHARLPGPRPPRLMPRSRRLRSRSVPHPSQP